MIEVKSKIGSESQVALSGVFVRTFSLSVFSSAPSGSPVNVSAEAVSSSRIMLTWSPIPEAQRNGVIIGYKVNKNSQADTETLKPTVMFWPDPLGPLPLPPTHSHPHRPSHTKKI